MSSYWNYRECYDNETVSGGTPDDDEYTPEQLADPATRQRIEALKILVLKIVEDAGEEGISVGELKARLGIQTEPRP